MRTVKLSASLARALEQWQAMPAKLRAVPIGNALVDGSDSSGIGCFGDNEEEYPGEAKDRARAFNLAAKLLKALARVKS